MNKKTKQKLYRRTDNVYYKADVPYSSEIEWEEERHIKQTKIMLPLFTYRIYTFKSFVAWTTDQRTNNLKKDDHR